MLIENHGDREGRDLAFEHGLSLLVESEPGTFLFDTGASWLFLRNARRLGCSLEKLPCAAISHGHNDHGGGLRAFLETNSRARIYVHGGTFDEHFARHGESGCRSIGLDRRLAARRLERFVLVDETVQMLPGA